jgi:predicted dehydrogenase
VRGVVVATPPADHFASALTVLEADKDVLVEKPMCMRAEDARRLVEEAERRSRILMAGHLLLYHPAMRRLKDLVESGEVGDLHYAYSQRVNLGVIRPDENALWSFAPHDVSMFLDLFGEWPVRVAAFGRHYLQVGVEDVVFFIMQFSGDRLAHSHMSWLDPNKVRRLTLVGNKKMVVFDDMDPQEKLRIFDRGARVKNTLSPTMLDAVSVRYGDTWIPAVSGKEPLFLEADHFLACIRERKSPYSGGREGARLVQILEAAQRSLAEGGSWIDLGEPVC